ncbi:MAG: hypothetical protein R3F24_05765 [Gammaproteobacteria bacterium]
MLTSGGVSAGKLDLVPIAIRALGGEIIFHKVAIRPGSRCCTLVCRTACWSMDCREIRWPWPSACASS